MEMSDDAWKALFARQLNDLGTQVEEIKDFTGLIASTNRDQILEALLEKFGKPNSETFRKTAKVYLELDGRTSLKQIRDHLDAENIIPQYLTILLRPLKRAKLIVLVSSHNGYVYRKFGHDEFIGLSDKLRGLLDELHDTA